MKMRKKSMMELNTVRARKSLIVNSLKKLVMKAKILSIKSQRRRRERIKRRTEKAEIHLR